MKTIKPLAVLIAALAVSVFAAPAQAGREDLLHINHLNGNVQVITEDTGDWVPASVNMPLRAGDRLWVPARARAELMMRNGSTMRLDQQSLLDIDSLDVDNSEFYLEMGRLYANFRAARVDSLRVDTPEVSVRVQNRGIFRVDLPDGSEFSDVAVIKGSVTVQTKQEIRRIDEGLQFSLRNGNYPEITYIFPPDEWEMWNRGRDEIYASNQSGRYLPEELRPYGPSLDPYGAWVYVPAYGYGWRPRVAVSAGWSPYRNGRWCWMGGNYVWISYDPWGYVPHHYGRWHFAASYGWVWLPPAAAAVHWGPGYVGWAVSGAHVAWVPLGPRDAYHGHNGYRGGLAGGAWATQVNKTVYQNIHVHNAVNVVHNETFIRGRHVDVKVRENPFMHQNVVARPDFRPEQAAKMPAIRNVANHEKPPAHVRDLPRRAREGGKFHAGQGNNPAGEKRVQREQRTPWPDRRDGRDGKAQQQPLTTGPVKIDEHKALPGQAGGKDSVAGSQDRRLQNHVEQRRIEIVNDPARQNVVKPGEIRASKETSWKFTNEDLKRFERARVPEPARPLGGERSLRAESVTTKKESPSTSREMQQRPGFGSEPAKEAQRLSPLKDEKLRRNDPWKERQVRDQGRPAETRQAQREASREGGQLRQPGKEDRNVELKTQAPVRTRQAGTGQEASRVGAAKAGDAVKTATPAPRAQSAAGHQEGPIAGQAGRIGGFGIR